MKWFDYAAPASIGEAIGLLTSHPGARLLAGGTDLLVQLRAGRKETDLVVDVKRIPELNTLQYDPKAGLTLGAAVPCYRIYGDATVSRHYPAFAEVASLMVARRFRDALQSAAICAMRRQARIPCRC